MRLRTVGRRSGNERTAVFVDDIKRIGFIGNEQYLE